MSGVAWDELLKLGLGDLGLSPDVFWSLTPVELMLLSGRSSHGAPVLDRKALDALMAEFPEEGKDELND